MDPNLIGSLLMMQHEKAILLQHRHIPPGCVCVGEDRIRFYFSNNPYGYLKIMRQTVASYMQAVWIYGDDTIAQCAQVTRLFLRLLTLIIS